MNFSPTQPVDLAAAAVCGSHAMTAASTSIAPVVEDDIEDLEDLGGAETADGVRVTRDLPPVVTLRAKRSASRAAVGGGGASVCHHLHLPLVVSASCLGPKSGKPHVYIKAWQQWCAVDGVG